MKRALVNEQRDLDKMKLEMIYYSSVGNLQKVKELFNGGVSVSVCDYDQRTPLHLAASEGHLEMVKFLIENNADPNPVDRFGNTPITDCIRQRRTEITSYLLSKGGHFAYKIPETMDMWIAAKDGDLAKIQALVEAGTDINFVDTDSRTALHYAAEAGRLEVVEYLLRNGAKVNCADRFGSTPLKEAAKNKHDAVVNLLSQKGAVNIDTHNLNRTPNLIATTQQVLIWLCEEQHWEYGAAWFEDDERKNLVASDAWYADHKNVSKLARYHRDQEIIPIGEGLVGSTALKQTPTWMENSSMLRKVVYSPRTINDAGFQSGFAFPVMCNSEVIAVLEFFSFSERKENPTIISDALKAATSMIVTELLSDSKSEISPFVSGEQASLVYKLIVNEGTFSQSMVSTAVDWYYNGLGLPKNYFRLHSPHLIAKHISAFMSSKLYVKDSGKPLSYREEEENYALYFVDANSTSTVLDVERSIEEKFLMEGYIHAKSTPIRRESGVSVKCYLSRGNIEPGGSSKLSIYLVSRDEYVNPNSSEHESDIRKIATGAFLRDVDENTRDSCQRGITAGLSTVAVVVQRELTEMTGCQTIFVTYKRGTTHSYFSTLSVLMRNNYITCFSKLVREFSNGYNQYIFYLNGTEENIMKFQEQANLLYIIPRTSLFPLLEEYRFSAEEVVYAYAAWKFTYHFLNKSSEEFTQLWENLKDNETHRNRLIRLKQTIRNEAATESRVLQVVLTYPELVKEFYQDFRKHFEPRKDGTLPEKPTSLNKTLFSKVERTVPGLLDTQILQNFCLFNQHIIKTNFYKSEKSALSIQLNPGFVPNEFPRVPYSIIMFLGSEFRGFHVRFEAISRGGIRLIKSPNPHHFIKNAENVFSENYNLAYTQQRKNKDIPEGGSKGTVLLAQNHQHKSEAAFKKYIDSMLDLLLVTPTHKDAEIVDHLGSEDIIFCGPDEGTAGMMGWAALHAKKRGYRYWSSFTTGKSPTLGGIPHDVYGMTTRGIHQFVLGVMAKKGIKEESVFKVQTGGPDGDLGSNEILISKDKTKAVADGSGVLYDPLGLDRTELTRLAKTKQMVEKFDRKKLSPGGFLVLLNDKDCVLPDGNKIENGMNFRNTFHLTPYASCDFFVPCGGRPESLTIHNVSKVFINGVPIFKNIVEGANLFLTQEARLVLEAAGVPVLKDASANKGGVTSSSLEVLAALCFTNEEHEKYMCVKGDVVPKFYQDYVVEVQQIIEQNARLEFECVWNENQKTKVPMSTITDKLSEKINQLNEIISKSNLWSNGNIKQKILKLCFPKVLQDLLGLEEIVKRLPESYISATLSAHLASRYIYEFGLNPGEFSFFDFMQRYS